MEQFVQLVIPSHRSIGSQVFQPQHPSFLPSDSPFIAFVVNISLLYKFTLIYLWGCWVYSNSLIKDFFCSTHLHSNSVSLNNFSRIRTEVMESNNSSVNFIDNLFNIACFTRVSWQEAPFQWFESWMINLYIFLSKTICQ